ncbi:hypothetical protein ACLOJK_009482 [Asimina triloba]
MEVSPSKGPRAMLVEANDAGLPRLPMTSEASKPSPKVICSGVATVKGPKITFVQIKNVSIKRLFDIEARALKILEDLLLIKSRVIQENVSLGLKLELDGEGQGPTELKLLERLPDVCRKPRDLEERIRLIDESSAWLEYQYHV